MASFGRRNLAGRDAIDELRMAAENRDWNACRFALGRILVGLPSAAVISLVEAVLRSELPRFEHHHPGESWPRQALDDAVSELGPDYTGPGGNAFAAGVEYLLDARGSLDDPIACRDWAVEAIGEVISGAMDAVWGAKYPDRWRRWFDRTYLNRPCSEGHPRAGFMEDPDVRQIELALWNDVADRLAAAWEDSC